MKDEILQERLDKCEEEITRICHFGEDLVPSNLGFQKIEGIRREIEDLTDGNNTVCWDKEKRPSCCYIFRPDYKNSLKYLSGDGTYFDLPDASTITTNTAPSAFLVNNVARPFAMGKYPMSKYNGKNYPCGLFGLTPAWGSAGGFTVSYNGIASRLDTVNSSTTYEDGKDVHNITAAEYALLHMKAVREGFQCHGNGNRGYYYADASEHGELGGYVDDQHRPVHVRQGKVPQTWRHNGRPDGVHAVGDCFRILHGLLFVGGVLRVIPYNNVAALTKAGHLATAAVDTSTAYWKEIDADGNFVDCGGDGTWRVDYKTDPPESGSAGAGMWTTAFEHQQSTNSPYMSASLTEWTVKDGLTIPWWIQELGLYPFKTGNVQGGFEARNYGTDVRVCIAGGHYGYGSWVTFGYRYCNYWRPDHGYSDGTGVPCFLLDIY